MKWLLTFALIFFIFSGYAQSPYLHVLVKMDSLVTDNLHYKIEMKICEPKKALKVDNWFSHDTSKINFRSLTAEDLKCGEFFEKGSPTLISGKKDPPSLDRFEFSNQVFAYEKILIFKFTDMSHRNWIKPMFIILPIKIKSFKTYIELTKVSFAEDKILFLDEVQSKIEGSNLFIRESLKKRPGEPVKNSSFAKWTKN